MAGRDPSFYKQYAYLSDYYEGASEHLKRMVPLLPRFDAIITISKITGQTFINFGVDKDKIHYTVQGIDMPEVAATSHKSSSDEVVLIYLGHFAPIKGFDIVVKALEQLPSGLKLKIKIFGSSAKLFYSTCSRAARRYVDVQKLLINEEVEAELSMSDGLIIPSLWHENTPYAVLRTLAMGRPVVGADQAGISHLITDGENGLLIPPSNIKAWAEKLMSIVENPEILRDMRKNCSYRKSIEDHAAEVERVIKEVSFEPILY
jgi:glycosyltransferase involved in cell wall biosynthesis